MLKFILFADDTNLLYSHKHFDILIKNINQELNKLSEWFKANRLSLNVKKTNYIIFGKKIAQILPIPKIIIDGVIVDRAVSTKFLGVIIDETLCWKEHVLAVSNKVSRGIGILTRVKYILPRDVLIIL